MFSLCVFFQLVATIPFRSEQNGNPKVMGWNAEQGAGGVTCDTSANGYVVARTAFFAQRYNEQNFDAVVNIYHPDSLVIPPSADQYLPQSALNAVFKDFFNKGLRNIFLEPVCTFTDKARNVIHELGVIETGASDAIHYYSRWIHSGTSWLIAFDIMSLNGTSANIQNAQDGVLSISPFGNATDIVVQREKQFAKLFNSQMFDQLQSQMYFDDAVVVPPTNDGFVVENIGQLFQTLYNAGVKNLSTVTIAVNQESDELIHEIGHLHHDLGSGSYYTRWATDSTGEWKIQVDVMNIGA